MVGKDSSNTLCLPRVVAMQLQALECLLNDLSAYGLRVWQTDSGQWVWEWQGHMALADGLGSAVIEALHWYFGLTPDPSVVVKTGV